MLLLITPTLLKVFGFPSIIVIIFYYEVLLAFIFINRKIPFLKSIQLIKKSFFVN